jgi:glutamate dehydrogenase/leucine dehydrogenase
VIISHFEWVQNLEQVAWSLAEVNQRRSERLVTATDAVMQDADGAGVSWRIAAASVHAAFFISGF